MSEGGRLSLGYPGHWRREHSFLKTARFSINFHRSKTWKIYNMLQPIMQKLHTERIILASGSPRRKEILENMGLKFEVVPSTFEEDLDKGSFSHPYDYVKETAKQKALEVAKRLSSEQRCPDLLIGADTVVAMEDNIFEKPANRQKAYEMLSRFSGRTHTVYTGVVLVTPATDDLKGASDDTDRFHVNAFHEATDVKFGILSDEIIKAYIATGESMDKAGAYGLQAIGGSLVEAIHGDYFNVVGFPLHHFSKQLLQLYATKTAS
ncbi:putative bifunctional dTTP/UTP pyrophosphatase/methyltransferase protein [Lamellibrachia satsuma]|nr:putative bifunctional dTTP/UTP pyrophosphatase/methyltransferase protein [Lamellibrachia satsuma]